MGRRGIGLVLAALALLHPAASAHAQRPAKRAWTVQQRWIEAHEAFLAGAALQGRGSATHDEAVAAAYVAAQFKAYGLTTAPGQPGFIQTATVIRPRLDGKPVLSVGGTPVASATLISGSTDLRGSLAIATSAKPADLPAADIVLLASPDASLGAFTRAASAKHIKLLIARETVASWRGFSAAGNTTRMRAYLEGAEPRPGVSLATVSDADLARLAKQAGADASLTLPPVVKDRSTTSNAVGYLPGTDADAGVLLISAHLDHLGLIDGVMYPGANDDASGVAAVLEIAHALAAGKPPRRGILFVCYGSEEIGGFGSRYFAAHSPVPLPRIAANIELEMIGAQDPKLPAGTLMMTGFERSNLGDALRSHGAAVTTDPYPDQHFFERSDNYQLALAGVVAHTISGWALPPTYHQPGDTVASLDPAFMTRAVQSLVGPIRWMADSGFTPQWRQGGRPSE